MQVQRACRAAISQNAAQKRHHVISTRAFAHNLRNFPQVSKVTLRSCEKKIFLPQRRKGAKRCRVSKGFLLCAFAPLREKNVSRRHLQLEVKSAMPNPRG